MSAALWIGLALIAGQLRLFLGDAAALAPSAAFAWTQLVARRSFRGSFAVVALASGLIEGPSFDAPWAAAPTAALLLGMVALATRRITPVRRPRGEAVLGTALAALGLTAMDVLRPYSAGPWASFDASLQTLGGCLATGLCAGALALLGEKNPALRAVLARR